MAVNYSLIHFFLNFFNKDKYLSNYEYIRAKIDFISELPDELIIKIITHLDDIQSLKKLACASKRMQFLADATPLSTTILKQYTPGIFSHINKHHGGTFKFFQHKILERELTPLNALKKRYEKLNTVNFETVLKGMPNFMIVFAALMTNIGFQGYYTKHILGMIRAYIRKYPLSKSLFIDKTFTHSASNWVNPVGKLSVEAKEIVASLPNGQSYLDADQRHERIGKALIMAFFILFIVDLFRPNSFDVFCKERNQLKENIRKEEDNIEKLIKDLANPGTKKEPVDLPVTEIISRSM